MTNTEQDTNTEDTWLYEAELCRLYNVRAGQPAVWRHKRLIASRLKKGKVSAGKRRLYREDEFAALAAAYHETRGKYLRKGEREGE